MKSCPAGRWHLRIWHLIYWLELAYDNSVPAFYLNKDGVNNSIGFACGSRQEINHLRLQSCAFSGKRTKRHSYSISTKLELLMLVITATKPRRENFVCMQRRIRLWCKKKSELKIVAQANEKKRLQGGGRKASCNWAAAWGHGARVDPRFEGPRSVRFQAGHMQELEERSFGVSLSHQTKSISRWFWGRRSWRDVPTRYFKASNG